MALEIDDGLIDLAELLRKSQGDKLASKDFFGRYWDAVIPTADKALFETGFLIIIDAKYVNYRSANGLGRDGMKNEVFAAVERVLGASRLKFRPTLALKNIRFFDEAEVVQLKPWAEGWEEDGWRSLEPHPGGLYTIYVSRPVREFLCRDTHDKPLWQERYPAPPKELSRDLNKLLTKCGTTGQTVTWVEHDNVVAARKSKRSPTQDKCVAAKGYSANAVCCQKYAINLGICHSNLLQALSMIYPGYYPNATKAKKRRVAEVCSLLSGYFKAILIESVAT